MLSFLATTFRWHSIMFALRGDGGGPIKMPMYANRMGMGFALLHYCRRVWPISDFPMIWNSCVLRCHSVPRRLLCYLLVFKLLQAAKSLVLGRKIFASGCGCTILKIHVDIQALERFKASMNYELVAAQAIHKRYHPTYSLIIFPTTPIMLIFWWKSCTPRPQIFPLF